MYGDKYGIESTVFAETFKMARQGIKPKEVKEQIDLVYVKRALFAAKKMHDEGDCISDNEIAIAFLHVS